MADDRDTVGLDRLQAAMNDAVAAQAGAPLQLVLVAATAAGGGAAALHDELTAAALLSAERERIRLLHQVIPHTGQRPWSEALEHLLEHVILRKQRLVDRLEQATGAPRAVVDDVVEVHRTAAQSAP